DRVAQVGRGGDEVHSSAEGGPGRDIRLVKSGRYFPLASSRRYIVRCRASGESAGSASSPSTNGSTSASDRSGVKDSYSGGLPGATPCGLLLGVAMSREDHPAEVRLEMICCCSGLRFPSACPVIAPSAT